MAPSIVSPHEAAASSFALDPAGLRGAWAGLHRSDAEPWPETPAVVDAWVLFHAGRFDAAFDAGRAAAGAAGALAERRSAATVADRARLARAHYVEVSEVRRMRLCGEVAAGAAARAAADPDDPNAHHLFGVALARQVQGANIGRALGLGLLPRIRTALETAIRLAPTHVHAHIALGAFHADVIDKLGALIARTQGVGKDESLAMFRTALKLDPDSVIARNEFAHALPVLECGAGVERATRLYREAAETAPRDAIERLEVEIAREALGD